MYTLRDAACEFLGIKEMMGREMFRAFDTDKSGTLDLKEISLGKDSGA
jgi:EF hand